MLSIGKAASVYFYALLALSLIPIISFFGKIFTQEGRESIRANPFMGLYFLIYFIYAYFFWFYPTDILDFVGINFIYQKMIYAALCIIPILEKGNTAG